MIESPPRDLSGNVIPHDHPQIEAGHELLRGITRYWVHREVDGRFRISSMAYKPSSKEKGGGMSINLKDLLEKDGKNPKYYMAAEPQWIGAVSLRVSEVRSLDLKVGYNPVIKPESNPYHGEIWGEFSRHQVGELKKLATWFIPINNVDLV